jgi:hypothetical protein
MKREKVLNADVTLWNYTEGEWLVTDAAVDDFFIIGFQKGILEETLNSDL